MNCLCFLVFPTLLYILYYLNGFLFPKYYLRLLRWLVCDCGPPLPAVYCAWKGGPLKLAPLEFQKLCNLDSPYCGTCGLFLVVLMLYVVYPLPLVPPHAWDPCALPSEGALNRLRPLDCASEGAWELLLYIGKPLVENRLKMLPDLPCAMAWMAPLKRPRNRHKLKP